MVVLFQLWCTVCNVLIQVNFPLQIDKKISISMVHLKVLHIMCSLKISFLTLLNSFCCHSNTLSSMSCMLSCTFCISRLDPSCSSLPCGTMFDEEILLNLTLEWKNTSTYKKNITANLFVILTIRWQFNTKCIVPNLKFYKLLFA